MKLTDLFEADSTDDKESNELQSALDIPGYQDPGADSLGAAHDGYSRTPVMTLRDVNTMKKVMRAKRVEADRRKDLMSIMYAAPSADEAAG